MIHLQHHMRRGLVMQGGGSLGAYECGVYKTLKRHGLEFDIVAGTSIGAINATSFQEIILKHRQKSLSNFGYL